MPKKLSPDADGRLTLKLGGRHKRMLETVLRLDGAASAVDWVRRQIEASYRPHAWGYFLQSLQEGKPAVMTAKKARELQLERWDDAELVVSVPIRQKKYFLERQEQLQRKARSHLGVGRLTIWVRDAGPASQPPPESLARRS